MSMVFGWKRVTAALAASLLPLACVVDLHLSSPGGGGSTTTSAGGAGGMASSTTSGTTSSVTSSTTSSSTTDTTSSSTTSTTSSSTTGTTSSMVIDGGCSPPITATVGTAPAPGPGNGIVWYRAIGAGDNQLGGAIALDPDPSRKRLAAAGIVGGTIAMDFGDGVTMTPSNGYDQFVVMYDTDGHALWGRGLHNYNSQPPKVGLAFGPEGALVMASTSPASTQIDCHTITGGAFAATFEANGDVRWVHDPDGIGEAHDIAVDAAGAVLVTGTFSGTLTWSGCPAMTANTAGDAFVAKLDGSSGLCMWSRAFGMLNGIGRGVAVDPTVVSGPVFVTGSFQGANGVGPCAVPANMGDTDAFVAKLGMDGSCDWMTSFGDDKAQEGYDVAVDGAEVVVVGSFLGSAIFGGKTLSAAGPDTFVAKLAGANGSAVWSHALGFGDIITDQYPKGLDVAIGANQQVVIAGSKVVPTCPVPGNKVCRDLFVERRAKDGASLSSTTIGDGPSGATAQTAYGVAANDGGVYVVGGYAVEVQLAPQSTLLTNEGLDILLLKLAP